MTASKRPGAHHSDRAGEIISGETFPNSTVTPNAQRHRAPPLRIVSWRVNRWLTVESVEAHS